jgi:preprotein translocase subunit SecF
MISPSIGAELITDAALAILLSMVGILAYLYVRFELNYSIGAIGAIVHDILVTVGLLTLLGVEFNVPVVAAVLTVIGYSLNDSIVNFDRVRENRVLMGYEATWYEVINRSVHEILNRTFVTSITTFIAALVLYLYGGIALRGFSITLLIGVIAGTFSSIYVSNLLLFELQKRFE